MSNGIKRYGIAILAALGFGIAAVLAARTPPNEAQDKLWLRDVGQSIETATAQDKPILLYLSATWCSACKQMSRWTFRNREVVDRIQDFVLLEIDVDENPGLARKFDARFLPTMVVLTSDGAKLTTDRGYMEPPDFLDLLNDGRERFDRLREMERAAEMSPGDVGNVLALAERYSGMGQPAKALPMLAALRDGLDGMPEKDRPSFLYYYGLACVSAMEFEEGIAALDRFVAEYSGDDRVPRAEYLVNRGTLSHAASLVEKGEYDAARAVLGPLERLDTHPDLARTAARRLRALEALGKPASALEVEEWIHGDPVELNALRGKVVLLSFFQIICDGSHEAHPKLNALQATYGDSGLQIVGMAVAFESEDIQRPEQIREYVAQNRYAYPVAIDRNRGDTFRAYRAGGTPWAVLIDREGIVRSSGFFEPAYIESRIQALLEQTGSPTL